MRRAAVLTLVVLAIIPASLAWSMQYQFQNLGTLYGTASNSAGPGSYAYGLNDATPPQVVGYSKPGYIYPTPNPYVWGQATLWNNGIPSGLGYLGPYSNGTYSSEAYGINDIGMVVGKSTHTSGNQAFLWQPNSSGGTMTGLGYLPSGSFPQSCAFGIDDAASVVGQNSSSSGNQSVKWTFPGPTLIPLPVVTPSSANAVKYGIDNMKTYIAGSMGSPSQAFLWDNGTVKNLGWLGTSTVGASSAAYGVVDFGWTVGQSTSPLGKEGFIYYNNETAMKGLGDLPGGSYDSAAYGINKSRVVVGYGTSSLYREAVLWDEMNGMVSLNTLLSPARADWRLTEARAINDRCEIVGTALKYGLYSEEAFLLTPITPTTIAVSKSALSYSTNEGVIYQPYQELKIQNSGIGTFQWSATPNAPWIISAFPTWGTNACGAVRYSNVAVSNAGLAAGTYSSSVTITAPVASNNPLTVPVTLTVNPYPKIGYSPASFSFTATQGTNPATQTLSIWNAQHDVLNWTVSESVSWLNLSPTSGSSTGDTDITPVALLVNTVGLNPGIYTANVNISSSRAVNTVETVAVTLTVAEGVPALVVSPSNLVFEGVQGLANPPSQTLSIENAGGGTLNWEVSVDSGPAYFSVNPASGSNAAVVTVTANTAGLLPGPYTGRLRVTATGTSDSPKYIDLTLTVLGQVVVTAPNGGEQLKGGSTFTIAWQTNGTAQTVSKTVLSYSTNAGQTWKTIKTLTGNPGTFKWTVPKSYGTACLMKVVLADSKGLALATDQSDGTFTIYR